MSCISAYAADTGTQIAVVIDSGHGSDESGKETEAEYNKKIAKEIKAYFETYFPSIKVLIITEEDNFKDKNIPKRANEAKKLEKPDSPSDPSYEVFFISAHNNASTDHTARGYETWAFDTNTNKTASNTINSIEESVGSKGDKKGFFPETYNNGKNKTNRGVQTDYQVKSMGLLRELEGTYTWDTKQGKVTAKKEKSANIKDISRAMLVEFAFYDNTDDKKLLDNAEFIKAAGHDAARGVAKAIIAEFPDVEKTAANTDWNKTDFYKEPAPPVSPRACFTPIQIATTWKQTICPGTANERVVDKYGTHTVFMPTECPQTGQQTYSGSYTGGGGGVVLGGGGGGQGGGGVTPPGPAPTQIASETCFSPRCIAKWIMPETQVCTGSSVILANGTYEFSETDLSVPAPAIHVDWTRSYRSNRILKTSGNWVFGEPGDGPLGFGWMTEYFARIENSDTYIDGQGIYTVFKKDSAGNFLTDMENGLILKKTSTGYGITEMGGYTYAFNASGTLTSIKDLRGNTITLIYDANNKLASIKDPANREALTLTYNTNNKITSVKDITGRVTNYEYDSSGNLIKVSSTSNSQPITLNSYTYNTFHGITTKSNAIGETYTIEYQYADKGIISRIIDPAGTELIKKGSQPTGHEMKYAYDFKNGTFFVTDSNGAKKKKIINDTGKLLLEEEISGTTTKTIKKIEYLDNRTEKITDVAGSITIQRDEWRNIIKATDGEGNETRITYNNLKKPLTITDALGNITRMEYDTYGNLIKITQAEGKPEQTITTYAYDNYNQVTSASTGNATRTITYNSSGLPVTIADPFNNTTTIQYDSYGNASAVIDANNNKTEFTYDTKGNLLTSKNALGNITAYTYNTANRPISAKDALNRITGIETDFKGRITAITDALSNKKEYQYDGNGNVVKIIEGVSITTMTYDFSNRLTSITDSEGNKTNYEYAGAGCSSCGGGGSVDSPIKTTDPLGNITKNIYDKAGRINSVIDPMGNVSLIGRDAVGRVKTKTDANGNITTYQYDALGRVTKQTDSNNGETIFTYDSRGNLKTLTDPQGNTTTFEYDLADKMIKETRPMGQVIEYAYYPNGLLKTVKDGKGQITTYIYDSASRLKEITYQDNKKDSFTYDSVGNMLTYTKDELSGTITYDNLNRKLSETIIYGSFSKTYSYAYDALSNKATFTSPEGKVYTYSYNKNNQPTSIAFDGKTIGLTYQWDRLTKATLPNGVTTDYQYNANSWLSYITAKNASSTQLDKQYEFDKVGNITRKTDNASIITDYNYDLTYQLTKSASPSLTEEFTYDKVGNRLTSASSNQPSAVSYTHNQNNELTNAGTIAYSYDQNGNTTQETNGSSSITKYIYNTSNRLERVELPNGRIATYTYDPFGRRIKKTITPSPLAGEGTGEGVTYYLYADEGLIGEYDPNGNLKKAYSWVPDSIWGTNPIFMFENGNYYFYHNDHLGTPQKLTDINGNVVWSATYTAFGEAIVDPASTVVNNLRFPGQYYDAETGKHYNLHRYYDPRTGRYTQIDPIGFEAGDVEMGRVNEKTFLNQQKINRYVYSLSNPNRYIDPDGAWPEEIHNRIIESVFSRGKYKLTEQQRKYLRQGSALADSKQFQGVEYSYMHVMRKAGQTSEQAETLMMIFIMKKLSEYKDFLSKGKCYEKDAYIALGMALHPLMDSTSPSHEGFQVWDGVLPVIPNTFKAVKHGRSERAIIFNSNPEYLQRNINLLRRLYDKANR